MKKIFTSVAFIVYSFLLQGQELAEISLPATGNNEHAEVSQWVGLVKISISYHSPNVHGLTGTDRKGYIWGELVHYGFIDEGNGPSISTPWRAGANETTTISFSNDVKINGKEVKAGTYALFLDLEKTGPSYWILSSNIGWGSFQYDPKYDLLRIPTNSEDAAYTEWLTYSFDERKPVSAIAFLQWENKRFSFKIEVPDVNQLYVDKIRNELMGWPGFNQRSWAMAASFCLQNKINLDEALVWIDHALYEPFRGVLGPSVAGRIDFANLQIKTGILNSIGRTAEADTVMDKAIHSPGADVLPVSAYVTRLLTAGRKDRALEISKYNQQAHPEEKFQTYQPLASVYTALGDKKTAIKNWETVIQNIPESMKEKLPGFQQELKKLRGEL